MFKCKIITPSGVYKELETSILNIVTTDGQRGLLSNHMPLVTNLTISKMTTIEDNVRESYSIGGGLLYFENNLATILVDSIENARDIDLDRAERAKQRALEHLHSQDSNTDMKRAQAALTRAINRIKVKNDVSGTH